MSCLSYPPRAWIQGGQMADARRGAKSEQQPGRSFIAGFSARTSDPEPPIAVFHSSSGDAEIERVTQSVQPKINGGGGGHSEPPLTHLKLARPPWAANTKLPPPPAHDDPTFTVPAHFQHSLPTQAYLQKAPPTPPPPWHKWRGEKPKSGHPGPGTQSMIFRRSSSPQTHGVLECR